MANSIPRQSPTPELDFAEAISRHALTLIQAAGAARESHVQGKDVRRSFLTEAHRALAEACVALGRYEQHLTDKAIKRHLEPVS